MKYNNLSAGETAVIIHKQTEPPFSGIYDDFFCPGRYLCRRCNAPLFPSWAKFRSGCGWPGFDDYFPGRVSRIPDPDGKRIEIICTSCAGHLGHVFTGEQITRKNIRHCVNSLSIRFQPEK